MLTSSKPGVGQPLLAQVHERERIEDVRLPAAIAERIEARLCFGQSELRSLQVTVLAGKQADVRQCAGLQLRVARSAVEQPLLPPDALQVAAPKPPVPAQIDGQAERRTCIVFASPGERRTEVVVIVIETSEPTIPAPRDGNFGMRRLDQFKVIREMAIADRIGLTGLGEA